MKMHWKKRTILLVVVVIFLLIIGSVTIYLMSKYRTVKFYSETTQHYATEAEVEESCTNTIGPGAVDYTPQGTDFMKLFKTRACIGKVMDCKKIFIKTIEDNTYQEVNLVKIKVTCNISGGMKKGNEIYLTDKDHSIYSDDIGEEIIVIPSNERIVYQNDSERDIESVGEIAESEGRIYFLEDSKVDKINNYWKLKNYYSNKKDTWQ